MGGYGVLTANAFQLLDEENEDPQAILEATKIIAAKAEEKKKAAGKEKPSAAPKPGSGAGQTRKGQAYVPSQQSCPAQPAVLPSPVSRMWRQRQHALLLSELLYVLVQQLHVWASRRRPTELTRARVTPLNVDEVGASAIVAEVVGVEGEAMVDVTEGVEISPTRATMPKLLPLL